MGCEKSFEGCIKILAGIDIRFLNAIYQAYIPAIYQDVCSKAKIIVPYK